MARVLYVDDNRLLLDVIGTLLEQSGYTVSTADSGAVALAEMREPFDAAVLDYELPDMNGATLANSLRRVQPQLPLVLFSGRSDIPLSALVAFAAVVSKESGANTLLSTLGDLLSTHS